MIKKSFSIVYNDKWYGSFESQQKAYEFWVKNFTEEWDKSNLIEVTWFGELQRMEKQRRIKELREPMVFLFQDVRSPYHLELHGSRQR